MKKMDILKLQERLEKKNLEIVDCVTITEVELKKLLATKTSLIITLVKPTDSLPFLMILPSNGNCDDNNRQGEVVEYYMSDTSDTSELRSIWGQEPLCPPICD